MQNAFGGDVTYVHLLSILALLCRNVEIFSPIQLAASYAFQAVSNAFPSVDTFFLLSGVLLAYLTLKELDRTKGRINWAMFYIHRYLRYGFSAV
jgi:peptidoglycan/LPS O-acetylase OafA/YrhL